MNAIVVYHTRTGHTQRAADDVAQGLRDGGCAVEVIHAAETGDAHMSDADIVVVGSPCHAGSCRVRGGLSGPVRSWLKRLSDTRLKGKVGGAFAVNYAYGGHVTVGAIEKALRRAGARVPADGVVVKAGVPFSLYEGPRASAEAREALRQLGRSLAEASDVD